MVTRAVQLEVVSDMSISAFLKCLVRFISCRGTPQIIVSDNAKHFKLANDTLNRVWDYFVENEGTQEYNGNVSLSLPLGWEDSMRDLSD